VAPLALLGVCIIIATIALTAARYRKLPDRVPIHFGLHGNANAFGPRYAIWMGPAAQIVVAAVSLWAFGIERTARNLIVVDAVLAMCLVAQYLILEAATTGTTRLNLTVFWTSFIVGLGVIAFAVFA
jgi:hypothetical protein